MEVQIVLKDGADWLFRTVSRLAVLPTKGEGEKICVWHQGSDNPNFIAPFEEVRYLDVRG